MSDWDPALYSRFEDERTRAARDLLAQVPLDAPRQVVDMGCGPGNSTELLVERWPSAAVRGLDTSAKMLEEARRRVPKARFEHADARTWVPSAGIGVVFANAIYQWVPDHLEVLPRVLAAMDEGSCLALQMPDNLGEPTHQLMRDVGADGPWAAKVASAARAPLPPPLVYYDALKPHARRVDIWHTIYNHRLADAAAVVDWVRSTGLRPFLDPLSEGEQREFLARYTERIAAAYPATADGGILLRFPRLYIVALK